MKKVMVMITIIAAIMGLISLFKKSSRPQSIKLIPSPTPILAKSVVQEKQSIFVPDWNLQKETTLTGDYDRWIYFGDESELPAFASVSAGKEAWFTIKINEVPDQRNWEKRVEETINIVKDYKLAGVALDLEINGLPTEDMINQINKSVEYFYSQAKQYYIKLAVVIYGDTFYRRRPFDLRFINDNSDEIMVMVYDFHKSRGEPGPNFPFQKNGKYDYDFQTMIKDFTHFVPPEKLTIIFGMFGYDWMVDEKKRPLSPARALTINEIRKQFLDKCEWQDCVIKRDDISRETEIDYTVSSDKADEQGIYRIDYHIVWFEDEQSVEVKLQYLKEKGIGSIAYWAYGYF